MPDNHTSAEIDVSEIQSNLHRNQLIWGKVYSVYPGKGGFPSYGYVSTCVPGLRIKCQNISEDSLNKSMWFKIIHPTTSKGHVLVQPHDGGFVYRYQTGDYVLGCVGEPNVRGAVFQLSERYFASEGDCVYLCDKANLNPGESFLLRLVNSTVPPRGEIVRIGYYKPWRQTVRIREFPSLPETIDPSDILVNSRTKRVVDEKGVEIDVSNSVEERDRAAKIVSESYAIAQRDGTVVVDNEHTLSFTFPLHTSWVKGVSVQWIGMRPNKRKDDVPAQVPQQKWFVEFVGYKGKAAAKAFRNHVFVNDHSALLERLSDLALSENWSFPGDKIENRILDNYFLMTYYGVFVRQMFSDAEDPQDHNTYRVFNTGLVNNRYEPIYCVLQAVGKGSPIRQRWKFLDFAVVGDSSSPYGKKLTKLFTSADLPSRIQYISTFSDLYYDSNYEIKVDYRHVFGDNISRLPLKFFLRAGLWVDEVKPILDEIDTQLQRQANPVTDHAARGFNPHIYDHLVEFIEANPSYKHDLEVFFERAVKEARCRAEWNYRAAVPCYYYSRACVSLLLPLSLTSKAAPGEISKPDVALVVYRQPKATESEPEKDYQGETILTLEMAYLSSRLITRPDSDWLVPAEINSSGEDEDNDEDE